MYWLEKKFYSILGFGICLVVLFWFALSKTLTSEPPKHYLNLNPPRKHGRMEEGIGSVFRQDILQPLGSDFNIHLRKDIKADQLNRKENVMLIREQLKVLQKTKVDFTSQLHEKRQSGKEKIQVKNPIKNININKNGFKKGLEEAADINRTVILSVVDESFVEFAINLYITSIKRLAIRNFLLVCFDKKSHQILKNYNISCFNVDILLNVEGNNSTVFGSDIYYAKTNVKTYITLEALKLGFHILVCDLDVVLFKNPLPYILSDKIYDIYVTMDRVHRNTGFMLVKSNNKTIAAYNRAWELFLEYHKSHDQAYIGMAISEHKSELKILELSNKQFPNGYYYFQYDRRFFMNEPQCNECVMTHNNYVGTAEAKRYRFKENSLWSVDVNGYYSDPQGYYLMYDNPSSFKSHAWHQEMQALQNALYIGYLSDRIVILPTFHCCDCSLNVCAAHKNKCSLMHMLDIKQFDSKFNHKYREHVFLNHKLVPHKIKSDLKKSPLLKLTDAFTEQPLSSDHKRFSCSHIPCDEIDLRKWLRQFDDFSVIRFSSLYGLIASNFTSNSAMKCSDYEQWQVKA